MENGRPATTAATYDPAHPKGLTYSRHRPARYRSATMASSWRAPRWPTAAGRPAAGRSVARRDEDYVGAVRGPVNLAAEVEAQRVATHGNRLVPGEQSHAYLQHPGCDRVSGHSKPRHSRSSHSMRGVRTRATQASRHPIHTGGPSRIPRTRPTIGSTPT